MAPRITRFGWDRHVWQIRVPILALQGTTAAILTAWTPGFAFELEKIEYVVTTAHTGAGGTRAFTLKKGSTAVAVATPTLATAGTVGLVLAQTSIDATKVKFTATDTITIDYATGTAFTAGEGYIYITTRQRPQSLL